MLLAYKDCKYLSASNKDDRKYIFTGQEKATKVEKENLKVIDENNVFLYGFHLIENYEDLQK